MTEMDGALIPFLKDLFSLSNFQAALVQFAFFLAFFLFSFPAARLLDVWGYRSGIAFGLLIMGLGSFGFIAAGTFGVYTWFLLAIFTLAAGVTLLQVAANPYMVALGGEEKGSQRLNIAQGFNALAKVAAPIFGAWAILEGMEYMGTEERIARLSTVYFWIGLSLSALALLFRLIPLPEVVPTEEASTEGSHKRYRDFPHLWKGAGAIFCYVGAEVSVATFMVLYLGERFGLSRADGAIYLSYYWGALMAGRLLVPMLLPRTKPNRVLFYFALAAAVCVLFTSWPSSWSGWALVAVGFFHSIMWGNIFSLSLAKLGAFTSKGSGLLVMAIVGGALVPPIQGWVADHIGLGWSYLTLLPAYAYLIWFALRGHRPQTVDQ